MGPSKKPLKNRNLFVLWIHDGNFISEDLFVNPDIFPDGIKLGDTVEIYKQSNQDKKVYLQIGGFNKTKANLQLSIKDTIASALDFNNREEVIANIIPKEEAYVDFVELTFKDQYISRSDMWRLKTYLISDYLYLSKSISYSCMRSQVGELSTKNDQKVFSGLVHENTKFIFRSKSAEFVLFFNMSKEMWDYDENGLLYFEKGVNFLLPLLFSKWQKSGCTHSLTLVMFSRTMYDKETISSMSEEERENISIDADGNYFQDFYNVICTGERSNWERFIIILKRKFIEYPTLVNWKRDDVNPSQYRTKFLGSNSIAEKSGFIEAINLAENMLESRHKENMDLTLLGQSIVVVTAGTGLFQVDPVLERQTKQRMIDKGIGCDMVCLSKYPLHIAPLFIMKPTIPELAEKTEKKEDKEPVYKMAHWVYTFFYSINPCQNESQFVPSVVLPEIITSNIVPGEKGINKKKNIIPWRKSETRKLIADIIMNGHKNDEIENIEQKSLTDEEMEKHDSEVYLNVYSLSDIEEGNNLTYNESSKLQNIRKFKSEEIQQEEGHIKVKPSGVIPHESTPINPLLKKKRMTSFYSPSGIPFTLSPKKIGPQSNNASNLNPFSYKITEPPAKSNRRRWVHLWSQSTSQYDSTNTDTSGPHWKSLTSPASLPLTTDYFPPSTELNNHYQEYPNTLSLIPDENNFQDQTQELLKELIAQRLSQGCQIVQNVGLQDKDSYYLSAGNSFHKLTYKPSTQNIDVKIYHAKKKLMHSNPKAFPYKYILISPNNDKIVTKKVSLCYESMTHYRWNYVDHLVCGNYIAFNDSVKFWRVKLIITPADPSMNPTSIGKGFHKFKEFLSQRIAKVPDEEYSKMDVKILNMKADENEEPSSKTENDIGDTRKVIRVEMDKLKTDRYEWIHIVYDSIFDPSKPYNMEFQWLIATGCVVNDFLSQCVRKAKNFGLIISQVSQNGGDIEYFFM